MILSIIFSNGKIDSFEVRRVCPSHIKNAFSYQPSLYYETPSHEWGKGVDIPMGDIVSFDVRSKDYYYS